MKILLVLPAAKHLRVRDSRTVPKRAMLRFSILPLTTVAALTSPQHEVRICDENVEPLDFAADVDVVGISFMTALAERAYEISREFRSRGKVVVSGGYHLTFCPEEVSQHCDAVVIGEAEGLWPRILEDIEAGRLQRIYKRASAADLSQTPSPRRDLTAGNRRHYVTVHAIQTGRGCTHGCRYCSIARFHGKMHRNRPIEHVLEEIRQAPRHFMFADDNIIADVDYAKELFRAMKPMKKRWISQCSIKIADDAELLSLAQQAGCRGMFIGVESLSEKNLVEMDKTFNLSQDYRRRVSAIRRCGIGVQAGMIVGMDHDDVRVFERTLRFLRTTKITALQLAILTPLPGTGLYEEFESQGRVLDHDWSHYDFRHCVIQPARMSPEELQKGADWVYRQFYRLDRIVLRAFRDLFTVGPIPAYLGWRLGLTYRYDNIRESIIGRNPAKNRRPLADCVSIGIDAQSRLA